MACNNEEKAKTDERKDNMCEIRKIRDFVWGIFDKETGECLAEDTYIGIMAMSKFFGIEAN